MSNKRWMVVLLILGSVALGAHNISHGRFVPPHQPLAAFPRAFGEFASVMDIPLSDDIRKVLGEGDFIQRVYHTDASRLPLNLYIGYYPRQEKGDSIHSPQHCLPGGGWEPLDISVKHVALPGGRTIAINRYLLQNGRDQMEVLYWFQAHGRVVASEYWSKYYLVHDAITLHRTDGSIVRVSAPVMADASRTDAALTRFVQGVASHIAEFVPN